MPSRRPFIDAETGSVDRNQLLAEAVPLAKLILSVVAVAAVPFAIAFLLGFSIFGRVFALIGQFVLAVGTGIVLLYIVVRGIDLASVPQRGDRRERPGSSRSDRHHFDGDEQETERAERERRDPDGESRGSDR
ncbi:hypothetical protein [Halobellus salinisoli]|uniref:hypothetical protein n=1 Tax=Halobellus salinisoli TaxID=3108500 RepID=UPI0030095EE3